MQKIFEIIAFSLKKIDEEKNWLPFCELVCNYIPHPKQLQWLAQSAYKENALHPGNGWGKTDVTAIKHLRYVLKHFRDSEKYRTLNIAITLEQAQLVQERIVAIVKNSPLMRDWLIPTNHGVVGMPLPAIRYCNGAKTHFRSTKKKAESVEGKEYGYISADEIALELYLEFIRDKILLPRLRRWTDSQMDFSATPKGQNAYSRVVNDIRRKGGYVQGGSSYDNPHIDHALLDYQRSTWSAQKVAQIIEGKFIDTADMMFASRVEKLFDTSLSYMDVEKGHSYIEGWDLARGRKGEQSDQTVGYRVDMSLETPQIVKRWGFQLPWTEKERENITADSTPNIAHSSIEREIRQANYESNSRVLIDSTGVGDTLYGIVQDIAEGVDFRGGRKDALLDHLQAVIDAGKITAPYIPELADQMTTYQRADKNLDTDDLMALAIACSAIPLDTNKYGTIDG